MYATCACCAHCTVSDINAKGPSSSQLLCPSENYHIDLLPSHTMSRVEEHGKHFRLDTSQILASTQDLFGAHELIHYMYV